VHSVQKPSLAMFPVTLQIPVAVLLLLGGLVACFAGYRLFRIVLGIYGFILGALLASTMVGAGNAGSLLLAAVVGGVIGAIVLNFAYFLGVVLVGAAFGAMVATTVWGRAGVEPHVLIVILFAVIGAVGAMMLQRFVIIVGTAFGGAWTALVGGLALLGDRAAQAAASANNVWVVYPLDPAPGKRWVLWVWLALGLAGTVTQLGQGKGTKVVKTRKNRKVDVRDGQLRTTGDDHVGGHCSRRTRRGARGHRRVFAAGELSVARGSGRRQDEPRGADRVGARLVLRDGARSDARPP
jgi:Domain of unknown function (DUF4203)